MLTETEPQESAAGPFSRLFNEKHATARATGEQPENFQTMSEQQTMEHMMGVAMTQQCSVRKGLKSLEQPVRRQ